MTQPNQNCYGYSGNLTDYKVLDYNLTDMTTAQILSHSELVDPCRGPNVGAYIYSDGSLSWSLSSPGVNGGSLTTQQAKPFKFAGLIYAPVSETINKELCCRFISVI